MTVFPGKCSVASCPFNLGARGVTCDWLRNGRGRCHHSIYREAWQAAHELAEAQELPARPVSLASRVAAADVPMSPERARQLLLDLREV